MGRNTCHFVVVRNREYGDRIYGHIEGKSGNITEE
jgi:hypothetical protein